MGTIQLNKDNINSIVDIYDEIARIRGISPIDVETYDCTKCNVSNGIYNHIKDLPRYKDDLSFGMYWCWFGPKVDNNLTGYTATIEEGFFKMKEAK